MEERRRKNNNNTKRMTLRHENLPDNLTEGERRLAKLKAIEGEKEIGKENPEPTVEGVREAAMSADAKVKKVSLEGGNKKENFAGDVAKKLNIPPEVVGDAIKSQEKSLERNQEEKDGILGKFGKGLEAIVLATSLGVGGAGVSGTAKALEMGVDAGSAVIATKRIAEGVPENPVLEAAKAKMTSETRKDAARIGMNFPTEGGVGGRTESTAEDITEQLKMQTKALEREMAEESDEENVETPEEREERIDEERDNRENEKAGENEEWTNEQLKEKKAVEEEREQEIHDRELGKAIQSEGQPLREKLNLELSRLKTPEQIAEFLGQLAKESSLETTIIWAKKPDGNIAILSANPGQERGSVYPEINDKKLFDFLRENPDAQIFDDHNHPKKVVEAATDECDVCARPEKSVSPPSSGDFNHALGGINSVFNDFSSIDAPENLKKSILERKPNYRVVTKHGMWEFCSETKDDVTKTQMVIDKQGSEYEYEAMHLEFNQDPAIQQLINKWHGKGFIMKFTPFDKNGKLDPRRTIEEKDFPGWGNK